MLLVFIRQIVLLGSFVFLFSGQAADVNGENGQGAFPKSPKMGKIQACHSVEELKQDFLKQLKRHEIYGNPELIENDAVAATAKFYQEQVAEKHSQKKGPFLEPNLFAHLTTDQLFDGAKIFDDDYQGVVPQTGDVLLNWTFLRPDNPGTFYSKRGMIHARTVLGIMEEAGQKYVVFLDGGWEVLSASSQLNAQTLLLRPKSSLLSEEDKNNFIKWGALFAPSPYDNQLIDNLASFRKRLHSSIDDRRYNLQKSLEEARSEALEEILHRSTKREGYAGFAPFGAEGRDTHLDPSGHYCSESGSDMFTYLGYRLYGEVPFEVVTAFSSSGKLPSWSVYQNALGGFGAANTPVEDLHHLYHNYFTVLDQAWASGLLPLPSSLPDYSDRNFVAAMSAYIDNALNIYGQSVGEELVRDPALEDLDLLLIIARNSGNRGFESQVHQIKTLLLQTKDQLNEQFQTERNLTKTIEHLFFKNKAYGPNHFLENGDHFELVGVFYNTDLKGPFQAAWVVNAQRGVINGQTTLYKIDEEADSVVDGSCVNTQEDVGIQVRNISHGELKPSAETIAEKLLN